MPLVPESRHWPARRLNTCGSAAGAGGGGRAMMAAATIAAATVHRPARTRPVMARARPRAPDRPTRMRASGPSTRVTGIAATMPETRAATATPSVRRRGADVSAGPGGGSAGDGPAGDAPAGDARRRGCAGGGVALLVGRLRGAGSRRLAPAPSEVRRRPRLMGPCALPDERRCLPAEPAGRAELDAPRNHQFCHAIAGAPWGPFPSRTNYIPQRLLRTWAAGPGCWPVADPRRVPGWPAAAPVGGAGGGGPGRRARVGGLGCCRGAGTLARRMDRGSWG